MHKSCDIIIPVYNSLDNVLDCVDSVLHYTDYPYHITIINDASDRHVQQRLLGYAEKYSQVTLVTHTVNQGFIKSVNRGVNDTKGSYVVLLNSDTVVTPGWLGRMVQCAESDHRIAIVNPVSNGAANLSIHMPPGYNIFSMGRRVAELSQRRYPDIITAVGFCMLIKREIIVEFGRFDEIYGRGYCEESDYCMKVVSKGYRVVVADDAFVYHRGHGSFGTWLDKYEKNRRIFDARWGEAFDELYAEIIKNNPLNYLRAIMAKDLTVARYDLTFINSLWHMAKVTWRGGGLKGILRRWNVIPVLLLQTLTRFLHQLFTSTPGLPHDPSIGRRYYVTPAYIASLPKATGLKIAFLAESFQSVGMNGDIADLTDLLILKGHTVYWITSQDAREHSFPSYTQPIFFRNIEEMAIYFPETDFAVSFDEIASNHWLSAVNMHHSHIPTLCADKRGNGRVMNDQWYSDFSNFLESYEDIVFRS